MSWTKVKTWKDRLNKLPSDQIRTNFDISLAMQDEIDELRHELHMARIQVTKLRRYYGGAQRKLL